MRKRIRTVVSLSVLVPVAASLVTGGTAIAATTTAATSRAHHATQQKDPLEPLVGLIAQRLRTGDTVSSAKFGTASPIDDPAREKVELDAAAVMAAKQGVDPGTTRKIFSDQIQANKVVQYGLYARWTARPGEVPKNKGDLKAVRTQLDQITEGLVRDLATTKAARSATGCNAQAQSAARGVGRADHFDALHVEALNRALLSVCT